MLPDRKVMGGKPEKFPLCVSSSGMIRNGPGNAEAGFVFQEKSHERRNLKPISKSPKKIRMEYPGIHFLQITRFIGNCHIWEK